MKGAGRLRNFIAAHPSMDVLASVGLGVIADFVMASMRGGLLAGTAEAAAQRVAIYQGAATFAGLALASATFVCAMTYQSSNILMSAVVANFRKELRRNWVAIIVSCLLSASGSIVLIFVEAAAPRLALSVAVTLLAWVLFSGFRSVYWMNYTLFGEELEPRRYPRIRHDLPLAENQKASV